MTARAKSGMMARFFRARSFRPFLAGLIAAAMMLPATATVQAATTAPTSSQGTDMQFDYSRLDSPDAVRVLYHPRRSPRTAPPPGAVDLDVEVAPGILVGCRFFVADRAAPVLLFFHGNGEIVADYDDLGPLYQQKGVNFAVADYRGYGWSNGAPTVGTQMTDAHAILDHLKKYLAAEGYSGAIFVMGRSLGSASAIELAWARQDEIRALIIESGFAETVALARTLGLDPEAAGLDEAHGYNNLAKIERVTRPILILHGQFDQLIPIRHAEKLHAAAASISKELQVVPGADHNSVIAMAGMLYFDVIKQFMNKVTGTENWRERRQRHKQGQ